MRDHVSIWSDLLDVTHSVRFIDVGGSRTRVLEAGSGPALILVHGTGGHLEAYSRNIAALAAHFRVVVFDMLGHGYTDKPDIPYTIDVLSDHLIGVMDALGIGRAYLSGESLGGWVVAWTAAHHPDRVAALILNTPGNVTNKPEVMSALVESSMAAVLSASEESVRKRIEWLFFDKSFVTDELVRTRLAIYTQPGFDVAMRNILAVQDWKYRRPFVWSEQWCSRITAPTDLLWTDHDPTATVDEAQILRDLIPHATFSVISGAGHWPQWERPDEFNEHHVALLAKGTA